MVIEGRLKENCVIYSIEVARGCWSFGVVWELLGVVRGCLGVVGIFGGFGGLKEGCWGYEGKRGNEGKEGGEKDSH